MTRADEAVARLREWWKLRQPKALAEFGLTAVPRRGATEFGWRDYVNRPHAEGLLARVENEGEALEVSRALLAEIAALRAARSAAKATREKKAERVRRIR
jgi:hypothetical protein